MTDRTDMFNILWGDMDKEEKKVVAKKVMAEIHKAKTNKFEEEAREVIKFLNERTGKNFRDSKTNMKFVVARLADGISSDKLRAVVIRKTREWKGTKSEQYLRPATLFNAEKCEQYIGEMGK